MFYICIHNDIEIEFAEQYPYEDQDEKDWAIRNYGRLVTECSLRLPELWIPYCSTEKQFEFEVDEK